MPAAAEMRTRSILCSILCIVWLHDVPVLHNCIL